MNVVLVASVVVAVSTVGWAAFSPQQGESDTEFSLFTGAEDGEFVARACPTEYAVGEQRELVVSVGNREHRQVRYRVLVRL